VELHQARKKILTLENKLLESNETAQLHQKRAQENVKKFIEIQSRATEWDTQALQIEGIKKDRDERIGDLRIQIAKLEEQLSDSRAKEAESSVAYQKLKQINDATTTDLEIAIKNNESAKIYNQMALEKMQEYIKTLATLKTKSTYTENENEVLKKKQDRTEARLKQVQSR